MKERIMNLLVALVVAITLAGTGLRRARKGT